MAGIHYPHCSDFRRADTLFIFLQMFEVATQGQSHKNPKL